MIHRVVFVVVLLFALSLSVTLVSGAARSLLLLIVPSLFGIALTVISARCVARSHNPIQAALAVPVFALVGIALLAMLRMARGASATYLPFLLLLMVLPIVAVQWLSTRK